MAERRKPGAGGTAKLTKDIEYLLTAKRVNPMDGEQANFNFKGGGQNIFGKSGKIYSRQKIKNFTGKKPQVMLKISSFRKTKVDLKNHLSYITRKGKIALKDQNNSLIDSKSEQNNIVDEWHDIELAKAKRRAKFLGRELDEYTYPRVAASIIISMPAGTDRDIFARATTDFCQSQYADAGYEYLMAFHNDTQHPHAHILLRLRNIETNRKLNPKRADLKIWRENLQEKMQEHGLDCSATPSRLRGKMASENRKTTHMDYKEMLHALVKQGLSVDDAAQLLSNKNKSKLEPKLNRSQLLSRRQANLKSSVMRALKNEKDHEAIIAFEQQRKTERQALLGALATVSKDIVETDFDAAASLISYAQNLPDSETEQSKMLRSLEKKIHKDSER